MQVLVVGDVMLDIYRSGRISRMSPEAPVPVILNAQDTYAGGGAANVAVNLAAMGLDVTIGGIVGNDESAGLLQKLLEDARVQTIFTRTENQPTITKLRVLGNGHHLVRIDTEGSFALYAEQLLRAVRNLETSWVVLSDYHKGSLVAIEEYIACFQEKGAKVLVDPKREISAYRGAWFIKPNKNEFTRYIGEFSTNEELIEKAQQAIKDYNFQHMLVTLGSAGMMYVTAGAHQFFPSVSQQVADITGAGDTVLAGLVYGLVQGYEVVQAISLAKRLAELSVTKVGTYVITQEDVKQVLYSSST